LVIVSAAASSPNVANQRADEPMPPLSQCYHGWPTTEFIDSQGFVRRLSATRAEGQNPR